MRNQAPYHVDFSNEKNLKRVPSLDLISLQKQNGRSRLREAQSMVMLTSGRTDTNSSLKDNHRSAREGIELMHSRRVQREEQLSKHYQRLDTITNNSNSNGSARFITQLKRASTEKISNDRGFIPKYFYSLQSTIEDNDYQQRYIHPPIQIEFIKLIHDWLLFFRAEFHACIGMCLEGEDLDKNGSEQEKVKSVRFIEVLLNLMQEFTTSNFFVLPFAFYQGGFVYSNIFLFLSFLLTAFPMIILIDLKRLTNLTLRELCYLRWGQFGKYIADICVFFTHFSDLYTYIQALTIMVTRFGIYFSVELSTNEVFWIQILLIFPLMSVPRLTSSLVIRYVCDLFMAIGFGISIYLNIRLISFKDVSTYSFTRSTNLMQSAMNMFSCFEESISVYEIYKDGMTMKQYSRFKIHIWIAHFCLYLMSLAVCNLTWLAFGENTKQNMMQMYDDKQLIVFIAKVFFILAAVPAYAHLFSPMDVMNKDVFGLYSENNRLAIFRLDMFDQESIVYFPRESEASGIRWFKLCYFHLPAVQDQMEELNKDSKSVKSNKKILFYLAKFGIIYFSIYFGMLTSDFSNAIFNICQIFFKTPISLILPCHLHLIFGNLSFTEKAFNVLTIIIGYFLTLTSFSFLL